jgi:mannosyltransferase OCH1-like enzyme
MTQIPKIIHYCWISGDPYSKLITQCIESWHKKLPDYNFVLWDDNKLHHDKMLSFDWVKEAYGIKKYAFVADFVRLYALYTEGGIYMDTDVQVVKDLSPLLVNKSFMGYETAGVFEAAVIGAQAGTEWIGKCLEYYKNTHFLNPDGTLFDFCPMPGKLDYILHKNYKISKKFSVISEIESIGLKLYPADYFSPKNYHKNSIKVTENTYTIHHFDSSWTNKNFYFYIKNIIHSIIILLFGQKLHNAITLKLHKYKWI